MDRDREEIKDYSNINLNIFEDNEEIESLSYQIVNNSFRDLLESSEI